MASPDPLDIDGSIVLKALPDVLAGEVAPEDLLDGGGCPLLHVFHPLPLHFGLGFGLGVLYLEVPLAVSVETKSLLALRDFDHVGLFVLSFLLF
jgi:hypothetical protein